MTRPTLKRYGLGLLATLWLALAQATPMALFYTIEPADSGYYTYRFRLSLDNHDGSWVTAMNFNWIVFGDGFPSSTLDDFVGDPASLIGSPFSQFTTSSGGNNGPTLLDFSPTIQEGGWVPASVGDSLTWSGRSRQRVEQGSMLFSNAQGSPSSPAHYETARLLPVPEASTASLMACGLLIVGGAVAGRRSGSRGNARDASGERSATRADTQAPRGLNPG